MASLVVGMVVSSIAVAGVVFGAIIGLSAERLWLDKAGDTSFQGGAACIVFHASLGTRASRPRWVK